MSFLCQHPLIEEKKETIYTLCFFKGKKNHRYLLYQRLYSVHTSNNDDNDNNNILSRYNKMAHVEF